MHINSSILIPLVLVAGFVLWVALRKLYFVTLSTAKDTKMKASNKTTRMAEGIILLCAGIAIFVFTATNRSTGGRLLILDQFNRGFVMINIIVALIAVIGLLAGVAVTFRQRTSTGFIIAVVFASFYGILLNNHSDFLRSLTLGDSTVSKIPYLLRLSNSPVNGAELWVNGVLLGKTPIQTTVEDFLQKVPYRPEPPEYYEDRTDSVRIPRYNPRGVNSYGIHQRWMQFNVPTVPEKYGDSVFAKQGKEYYARVKFDGQWGYFDGGGGGGGNSDGVEWNFPAVFPNLQERFDKMLDIARLNDYKVNADWFEAMETFGQVGLNAIYKALEKEPDMGKVIDDWAIWKYELDKVTDEKSAWEIFENICDEADQIQCYSTMSITGRAVEMLTSKINPEQIVNKAVEIIRSNRTYGWTLWTLNGKVQFGMTNRPEGLLTPSGNVIGGGHDRRNDEPQVSSYAIAHAIWTLDKLLEYHDDIQPNIVELKVVPNLLCWQYNFDTSLRLAAVLGGPVIERFLYRNNWRKLSINWPDPLGISINGTFVNKALFLMANLNSPFGQKFRIENKRLLMDFADTIDIMWFGDSGLFGQNPFDFLFVDKEIALEYWPEFKVRTMSKNYDALKQQFHYLVNMEPLSTVDMYVQAWRGYSEDYSNFQDVLKILDNLPQDKHDLVITALEQSIKEDVSHIKGFNTLDVRNYLLREIKSRYWSKTRVAQNIIDGLIKNTGEYKPQAVSDWLEHEEPGHPLVNMLAESDEPQLRLLVMGALRENPTPVNRAILEKLLNDSNEQVRSAAMQVAAELEKIKNMPVNELVSEPKGN